MTKGSLKRWIACTSIVAMLVSTLGSDMSAIRVVHASEINDPTVQAAEEPAPSEEPAPLEVPAASGEAAPAEEAKSDYTIVLKDAGAQKVAVIKAVKDITGLGLGEAKAIVDGAPATVKENVPTEEAEAAKKTLEEAGASVDLQ